MLKENIKDFIFARIEKLPKDNENLIEYEKSRDNAIVISRKIINLLSEKNKKLFFDYEEYINETTFYEIEEAYKTGFKDCFEIFLNLYK